MKIFGILIFPSKQEKLEKQWRKNLKVVSRIIDGDNYSGPTVKEYAKKAFDVWMRREHQDWETATKSVRRRVAKIMKANLWHVFQWKHKPSTKCACQLVSMNFFTDPFPSTHDMPEWALGTKLAEIMILLGVSEKDSAKYYVHVRHHFVNHDMVTGIIQFDLYREWE